MSEILVFERGTIVTFTEGAYSDFGIIGYVVFIKDANLPALAQQFCATHVPKDKWDDVARFGAFPSWLVANGYAMPVDTSEVHLGEYGDWNTDLVPAKKP